ncbi:hypothetical protein yaldo0001_14290 [Yersinia aldovae ATCC 35236]|uniref:hypothetical protein n=1 Tax=Yersinia aldovae TaxID=29483 RepID=UPI0001A567FD|nr:hypothetical protein [Yersinia aldovae]EEP95672.1 hypothetical protein yaldo0001_14290 [Yersinia aldovae ATCC 35236]
MIKYKSKTDDEDREVNLGSVGFKGYRESEKLVFENQKALSILIVRKIIFGIPREKFA